MSPKKKKRRAPHPNYPTSDQKRQLANDHKGKGCLKCGETRLWVIDLHHIKPKTKKFGISRGIRSAVTWKAFRAELRKCVPLCRNHHGDFHHREAYEHITLEDYLNDGTN